MSGPYEQLLGATIQHLEELKSRGTRHVVVSSETLVALTRPVAVQSASVPAPDLPGRTAAFAALRERALACVKCPHLASSRKNVVFGVGNLQAQLMFVGEAPGADEDEQG